MTTNRHHLFLKSLMDWEMSVDLKVLLKVTQNKSNKSKHVKWKMRKCLEFVKEKINIWKTHRSSKPSNLCFQDSREVYII